MKRLFHGPICVIGVGRWGTSLLSALQDRGIPVISADPRKPWKAHAPAWTQAEVFWLCVPDAEIESSAGMVVRAAMTASGSTRIGSKRKCVVLHSSGVYSSQILKAARDRGASVASVHPFMSFPTRRPVALEGVPFAVEAEGHLRAKLFRLIRLLGGKPFSVTAEGKALYHAAAVMASPLLVSLATAAEAAAKLSGLSQREATALLEPIMTATLAGFFRRGGAKSFSGPFVRGDAETVSLHLAALRSHPELAQVYGSLALYALGKLPVENKEELRRTLIEVWGPAEAKRFSLSVARSGR